MGHTPQHSNRQILYTPTRHTLEGRKSSCRGRRGANRQKRNERQTNRSPGAEETEAVKRWRHDSTAGETAATSAAKYLIRNNCSNLQPFSKVLKKKKKKRVGATSAFYFLSFFQAVELSLNAQKTHIGMHTYIQQSRIKIPSGCFRIYTSVLYIHALNLYK